MLVKGVTGGLCNRRYPPEMHIKLKSREISFAHNIRVIQSFGNLSQSTTVILSKMRFGRISYIAQFMMTSSNGNTFRVTGLCAGNSPGTGEFSAQRLVTWGFDVFFDLHPNKRLSKQSWDWWFETPSRPLWRLSNNVPCVICIQASYFQIWPIKIEIQIAGLIHTEDAELTAPCEEHEKRIFYSPKNVLKQNPSVYDAQLHW